MGLLAPRHLSDNFESLECVGRYAAVTRDGTQVDPSVEASAASLIVTVPSSEQRHSRAGRLLRWARCRVVAACVVLISLVVPGAVVAQESVVTDSAATNSGATESAVAESAAHFTRDVAPLLAGRCLECHRGADPAGKLDLTRRETMLQGGDSGVALVAGRPEESLLWQRVAADEMPPKHPLSAAERQVLHDWIADGAAWQGAALDPFAYTSSARAGYDWWALQPLAEVSPVELSPELAGWVRNPIDMWVAHRLHAAGLQPSARAEPRALVRRLYFDLVGLPPTPAQLAEFERDPSDAAYDRLVDELLDSPHYGERWGRHWLDVVRFGESDGFERNAPRENSWPYRDWVIDALNRDLPYDEFVRWQLAGDLLRPGREGTAAAGFLVAGLHNTVVGSSERMRRLARQDELEEVIGTIGQTFLGLTVNCARCHDHKFDPVSTNEYYQFVALIDGMNHGEVELPDPTVAEALSEIAVQIAATKSALEEIDRPTRAAVRRLRAAPNRPTADAATEWPQPIAVWEFAGNLRDAVGKLHGTAHGEAQVVDGALVLNGRDAYVATAPLTRDLQEKTLEAWVLLDNLEQQGGAAISLQSLDGNRFDAIVFGEQQAGHWMAGSDLFQRTQPLQATAETAAHREPTHVAIVYRPDGTIQAYRNGQPHGQSYRSTLASFAAGQAQVLFGLRHGEPSGNRLLAGRILRAALYDRALDDAALASSATGERDYVNETELTAQLDADARARRQTLLARLDTQLNRQAELETRRRQKIYSVQPSQPEAMRVHPRGGVAELGEVVAPAGLGALRHAFDHAPLAAQATDSERRLYLAAWITDHDNPLFARVIVNRLWHYHFGRGIVETPNDFGFNGGRPSHPELLDWLARQLQSEQYRLKPLHRLIVRSATYRQAAQADPAALAKDADNRWLWRYPPRRLDAESIRDAMLAVSGELNPKRGGPGFRDVSVDYNDGTTYFEPLDTTDIETRRRTIYRFTPRGGRSTVLDAFDCPDPSATAPRRSVTTTPLQALSLLNNSLVLSLAERAAERTVVQAAGDPQSAVTYAWHVSLGRAPDAEEAVWSHELVAQQGLAALYRALWNSNEFVVIE